MFLIREKAKDSEISRITGRLHIFYIGFQKEILVCKVYIIPIRVSNYTFLVVYLLALQVNKKNLN